MRCLPTFPGFPEGSPHASRTYFHSLSRSIIFQMLTGSAAETIYRRVRALTPESGFPKPAQVARFREQKLRGCGLSGGKVRALKDLARKVDGGALRLSGFHRKEDAEIIAAVTQVHGIGVWTVQMFLLFRLGRLDVMPLNDLGVQEGIRRLDRLADRPSPSQVRERCAIWSPLSSVASWQMWNLADGDS
ncbi:MAG: DNA-3-methyladenine glycosylase 2 family protein [Planctomycetota bacterium]|nr:hypothetical protein [Planctomycetota bacterium]MEE2713590.1 DNA-3-methyladenine glycosylase 2 family protein [Planctomycetota bacterium]